MRVRRSLTIKQMAAVSSVTLVMLCIFTIIQLFHFVQQRREDYAQQLENIAHSVRKPLAEAVLNVDIPESKRLLNSLLSVGILARADVVLPNELKALHADFPPERPVPATIARVFNLPVKISVPLYALERVSTNPHPLAYLVLQADSYRIYKFILSLLSTMLATYLLLTLILTVSISWCMNRLLVHPLRDIARELESLRPTDVLGHHLSLSPLHSDDELGMLVRNYNRNQLSVEKTYGDLSRLSTRHPISGLPNENLFMELLTQYIRFSLRPSRFNVLLIGIETLREVSGILTEIQRNELLRTLVEKIRRGLPDNCELSQLSDSEFVLLARGVERPFQAMRMAREVMERINAPLKQDKLSLRPTASIGISHYSGGANVSAHDLMLNARSAMVSAHHLGKNQILFFEPELTRKIQKRLSQESEILQAIERDDFTLFLQPQINLATNEIVGAEALLRRKMINGRYSLEADFIPFVEDIGIIVPLGYWVLEQGCRILADWQKQGIDIPLSVNLSGVQIQHRHFLPELKTLISRYQIKPGTLILEITETARISDLDRALKLLTELRLAGVSVALDDFGMGYSSLDYLNRLRRLPIDIIKIDRSFISSLPQDDVMVRIVSSIAGAMNIQVIAEGVEKPEQRDWLQQHNILLAQGFLFARPLPRHEFEKRLGLQTDNSAE